MIIEGELGEAELPNSPNDKYAPQWMCILICVISEQHKKHATEIIGTQNTLESVA